MWVEKEFIICVKTYPEYSTKYIETVCTAAILKDTGHLIRLYPIPYRYLIDEQQFRKYQLVRASIRKSTNDNRPESYNIRKDSIRVGAIIEPKDNWSLRNEWVLSRQDNIFRSLELLQERQLRDGTSMGLLKPKTVNQFSIVSKTPGEIQEEEARKRTVLSQHSFLMEKKDLELIPFRFMLSFKCDYKDCKGHEISILDWEIGQLYRNVRQESDWKSKIEQKVDEICSPTRDTYFFMGNMAARRKTFCILGFYYPPKGSGVQMRLFR